MLDTLRSAWAILRFLRSDVYRAARRAVLDVKQDRRLQLASRDEPNISYCPRCGQIPKNDRRLETARELALSYLPAPPPIHRLNLALELAYWIHK